MFFKKIMTRLAAENKAEFDKVIEKLTQDIGIATNMADPNASYSELSAIEALIEKIKKDVHIKIDGQLFYYTTLKATRDAVGVDLSLFLSKREKSILTDGRDRHIAALEVLSNSIIVQKIILLDTRLSDMAQLDSFPALIEKFPDVALAFAKSAAAENRPKEILPKQRPKI